MKLSDSTQQQIIKALVEEFGHGEEPFTEVDGERAVGIFERYASQRLVKRDGFRWVRADGLRGTAEHASLADVEQMLEDFAAEDNRRYRIQKHTVWETPWEDVADE